MHRRTFISTVGVGTAALAGCSRARRYVGDSRYRAREQDELLPDRVGADWPDPDLEPAHDVVDGFARVWVSPDRSIIVMMGVAVHDSVSAAEEAFEEVRDRSVDPRSLSLADEALVSDDRSTASAVFRHRNALGEVVAALESAHRLVPDRDRAVAYAEILFREWRD